MNSQRYATVVTIIAVAVFFTNLSLYKYQIEPLTILEPKYDLLVLGVLCLPVVWHRVRQGRVPFNDKLLLFVFVAVLVFLVGTLVHSGSTSLSPLILQFTGLAFLVLCYLLFKDDETLFQARRAILVCLVLAVLLNLFEVLQPGMFSVSPGRSAGLYINPNISAVALITGSILAIGLVPVRMRIAFLIIVGAGVFSTMSRSGMIIFVAATIVFVLQGVVRPDWRRAYVLANTLILLGFVLFFYYAVATVPEYHFAVDAKIGTALGLTEDAERDELESVRGERLEEATILYAQNPIFGVGLDRAWALEIHNSYLLYSLAYGLVGWLFVPALALVVAGGGDRRVALHMALALVLMAVFSHDLMTDRTVLLPLALASVTPKDLWQPHD